MKFYQALSRNLIRALIKRAARNFLRHEVLRNKGIFINIYPQHEKFFSEKIFIDTLTAAF